MAAGKSSRFKTERSKLVEKICGQEMILYSTKTLEKLNIPTTVIVGHKKEDVQKVIKTQHQEKINFIEQKEQKGTAHALMCSKDTWEKENILIMNADAPLLPATLINALWERHKTSDAAVSFVTAYNIDPSLNSYGKVIKENNEVKIVEAKDYEQQVKNDPKAKTDTCCINAGIYLFKKDFLNKAILEVQTSSVTGEFYITDLISIASKQGLKVEMVDGDVDQVRGINTMRELWIAEQIKQAEIINHWMSNGVRFQSAQNTYVALNVTIGAGTFVGQGAQLFGNTDIDVDCYIEAFTIVDNSTIGKNTKLRSFSIIKDSCVKENSSVGPFAHLNSNSVIEADTKIENFVEVRASHVGTNTNVKSLSYVGNTTVGKNAMVGAGTIVCDHNGVENDKTTIEDNTYVGANNTLVSPVTVGENAFTAAGSVITKDVPKDALAIARTLQTNKDDYRKKIDAKSTDNTTTFTGAVKDKGHTDTTQA